MTDLDAKILDAFVAAERERDTCIRLSCTPGLVRAVRAARRAGMFDPALVRASGTALETLERR